MNFFVKLFFGGFWRHWLFGNGDRTVDSEWFNVERFGDDILLLIDVISS